jgi:TonB family protein
VEGQVENHFSPQGLLRIRVDDSIETLYNEFQGFHGSVIPRSIVVAGGKGQILTISITSLESLSPGESKLLQDATPRVNLPAIQIPVMPDSKELKHAHATAAKLLNQAQPVYPPYAKQHGIQGAVVIEASIDEDGKVREPYVIGSAGALLDGAAMDAVRKWRYRPTTIDGMPICVETTITVFFRWQR